MNPFPPRNSIGLSLVGDDLVLVEASLRGESARWTASRVEGFLSAEGEPAALPLPKGAPVVLVLPMDRLLRRDVAMGEQTIEELRAAVAESPDAFFPVGRDEGLLWDAHAFTDAEGARRAMLFAARLPEIEPALNRLAQAGATPTRLAPSGAAWSVLRFAHDDAPSTVLEVGAKGWSVSAYDGLSWSGVRSGFGAAPAEVRDRARRDGWGVCDWRTAPALVGESSVWRPEELTAEHAALGGALLELFHADAADQTPTPTVNLLGRAESRSLRMGPLGWFAAACAAAVVGLLVWNDASHARAMREQRALAAEVASLRPAVERVEALRAQAESVLAAHNRLAALEGSFRPVTGTLAELAAVLPAETHAPTIEFADSGITATVITSSRTQAMQAIEMSPLFARVMPTGSAGRLPSGNEQLNLGFGFEAPPPAAQTGGAP